MTRLVPIKGMDNVSHDDQMSAFGQEGFVRLRNAINVDVSSSGRVSLRRTGTEVTATSYKNLWQSPLHGDVFATLDNNLVRVNPVDWSHEVLGPVRSGDIQFEVINNLIYLSDGFEIYGFDGARLEPIAIETPSAPLARLQAGSLKPGKYNLAITWLSRGKESGLSALATIEIDSTQEQGIAVTLPYCFDAKVDEVAVYITTRDGTELQKYGTYPIAQTETVIQNVQSLGRAAQFQHLSPMPAGKFLGYWQGRLLSASRNMIKFSQALNFHLHDERYDYIALPQRITFMKPTDSGIWVGQVDHVVFLTGTEPRSLNFVKKTAQAPIPGSAIYSDSEDLGEVAMEGRVVVWLSQHGYVVGTPAGNLIEPHANRLKGITAKHGQSVRFDQRVITVSK